MQAAFTRFQPVVLVAALWLAMSTGTRILLALRPDLAAVGGIADWVRVFGYGLLFDLVTALYLLTPAVLWLALLSQRLARSPPHRAAAFVALSALTCSFMVLAVSEWLFWDEFGGRFNFIAVDYLLYTHEVVLNVWQSYPIGKLLFGLAALAVAVAMLMRRSLWHTVGAPLAWRTALGVVAAWGLAIAASVLWLDADTKNFSAHDAANDLAGNGLYEFFAANHRNELSYDRHYATLPPGEALALVRAALGVADGEGVERHVVPQRPERRLSVVLVSVESLGAEFLGSYADPRGLTPNLDRLARESLWFSAVYATGNRTVRGLEALSLALPPSPGQSIVRRPNNDMLFSLGSVFEDKGYAVLFAYGGYGYFDNMNAFFDANDYRVVDRRDIPAARIKFENVWGVADEHLFDQVLDEIDREHAGGARPFFAHVMTTSNHRPYTYPAERIDIPSGTGREGAVKYSDYAIGRFLEQARRRPWFDDTLFVITADHGANARGTMRIPVEKYLIPLFIYSPKHVAPARIDRLMSQIDIAPTVLGLLDFNYYSKFFGRDVLASPPQSDRAFVANYQALGYLRGDRLALLYPKRKTEVFRVDRHWNPLEPVSDPAMLREAIGFYSAASFVFRSGLYRDEEQTPPQERAALLRLR